MRDNVYEFVQVDVFTQTPLAGKSLAIYEVGFLDSNGRTIALTELRRAELLLLQHEPVAVP